MVGVREAFGKGVLFIVVRFVRGVFIVYKLVVAVGVFDVGVISVAEFVCFVGRF